MGRSYRIYLAGEVVYACRQCGNHLAIKEGVISQDFHGQHGRAYLINHVVNVYTSPQAEDRDMRTGKHTVRDVFCSVCNTTLGWKYDFAYREQEKYKEGKFILERQRIDEHPEDKRCLVDHQPMIIEEVLAHIPQRV